MDTEVVATHRCGRCARALRSFVSCEMADSHTRLADVSISSRARMTDLSYIPSSRNGGRSELSFLLSRLPLFPQLQAIAGVYTMTVKARLPSMNNNWTGQTIRPSSYHAAYGRSNVGSFDRWVCVWWPKRLRPTALHMLRAGGVDSNASVVKAGRISNAI
jgi:hypothetical protein